MKHFFIYSLLLISLPAFGQFNGVYFDQSRCQSISFQKPQAQGFPFTFNHSKLNNFCHNYFQAPKANPKAQLNIWKTIDYGHQLLNTIPAKLPIAFPIFQPGQYLITSNDLIQPILIQIDFTTQSTQINIFYNCATHH